MSVILTPLQLTTNQLLNNVTQNANQLGNQYRTLYNAIWNPPANAGYTTAQILGTGGLNTNAAAFLAFLANIASLITSNGGAVPTVTGAQAFTANTDGTVTLTA